MFTYYLLSQLQPSQGEANYEELTNYLVENVVKRSAFSHSTGQLPQVIAGKSIEKNWRQWRLK